MNELFNENIFWEVDKKLYIFEMETNRIQVTLSLSSGNSKTCNTRQCTLLTHTCHIHILEDLGRKDENLL